MERGRRIDEVAAKANRRCGCADAWVMAKELGWRDTALISAFSVVLAVVIATVGRFGYALFA